MTAPDDKPPDPPPEFTEHVLGSLNNEDGTPPNPAELRRRFEASRAHIERLAAEHGITLHDPLEQPADPVKSTPRAQEIKAIADAVMPQADRDTKAALTRVDIQTPEGLRVRITKIELPAFQKLGSTFKKLVQPIGIVLVHLGIGVQRAGKQTLPGASATEASIEPKTTELPKAQVESSGG